MTPAPLLAGPPWRVDLSVHRGDGVPAARLVGEAPPPTAGQALAVLDPDATAADLRRAAWAWLPARLASGVCALSDDNVRRVLALFVGLAAEADPASSEPNGAPPSMDARALRRASLRVAKGFGWTLAETLAMPWPDYLAAAAELPALDAADTLRRMQAAHPTEAAVDRLVQEARGGREAPARPRVAPPWERDGVTQEEHRRRVLAEIARKRAAAEAAAEMAEKRGPKAEA